jgi:hypothetical protein
VLAGGHRERVGRHAVVRDASAARPGDRAIAVKLVPAMTIGLVS